MQIYFNKQKIFEVLLTALISAGIAFLQSLATAHFFNTEPLEVASLSGVIGGAIRACRV
jgi:hypothetical protein